MAEQIPYGVATSLINTLALLASNEIASIYGVEDDIEWLKNTVEDIQAVLSDADHKQHSDQLVRRWISKLKQVLYEADDLLDEIHTQHLLRTRKGKVRNFFSSSNPIAFRRKMAREIRGIREKFNAVAETMSALNLDPRVVVVDMKHEQSSNRRETSSFVLQDEIVGREGNKKDMIELLLKHDNNRNQNVSLVAIVGIGGLGKTALAQLLYKDAVAEPLNFQKRMWVCVSQDFDAKALVKQILESLLDKKEEDHQSLELLQNKLRRNLDGQKFLLVLDDIWDDFAQKWEELRRYLMCGGRGSKILLTTRDEALANKMGLKQPYVLKGLENDQSWTLLKSLAFDQDHIMSPNQESIGRKIAEKCVGVPLAIRAMGNLLKSKPRERDWEDILEADFWKLGHNSIMPILKLSYDSLTFELKQCFAYCSLYPKDWSYKKNELIALWMAQGFLENEDEKQCPEDVGEEYVCTLLRKSFLQDVEMDEVGEIKYFKMHDLMHDLSQSIASSYHCMYGGGRKIDAKCFPIHASFEEYNSDSSPNLVTDPSRLRTLLEINRKAHPSHFFEFKRLRSLDLSSYYGTHDLPESIGKMIHLRYLNLSYSYQLTCLPKNISNLINLQILRLGSCRNLKFCSDIITKLINLRQLDIGACKAFEDGMPIGLDRMTNLQSLPYFIVGDSNKKGKKAKLNELKELNLRGKLVIEKLDLVRNVEEESKDANLRAKKNIISLSLNWTLDSDMKNSDAMQLLENLEPHQNLKVLTVQSYPGVRFSDRILSCKNLVKLEFSHFKKCQYLELSEGLICLKTLHIIDMTKLKYIYCKGYSSNDFFPSLEKLSIEVCRRLKGWLREANDQNTGDNKWHPSLPPFSCLSSLYIRDCPNLSRMPTFPNLVSHLGLAASSTKPLLDTLNMTTIQPSTSYHMHVSLSMLKSLTLHNMDIGALPEKWMQNLSSLKCLCIMRSPSLEKLFHHMLNLSATLEEFQIGFMLGSWKGDEDYGIQWQHLQCLHSLQTIQFTFCNQLKALPNWICHLHSLQLIHIMACPNLESLPERMRDLTNLQTLRMGDVPLLEERCKRGTGADWKKIEHIPNIRIGGHWIKSN